MITNEIDNLLIFQISYRRINTLSSNRKKLSFARNTVMSTINVNMVATIKILHSKHNDHLNIGVVASLL